MNKHTFHKFFVVIILVATGYFLEIGFQILLVASEAAGGGGRSCKKYRKRALKEM